MKNVEQKIRYTLIDQLRGLAVLLMVVFHFFYNLNFFDIISVGSKGGFWSEFAHLIVTMFLISVGLSLTLVHNQAIKWQKFLRRLAILVVCAAGISLSTYVLFPDRWIYFGTIHSIAVTSVLALPFLRFPRVALVAAALLLGFNYVGLGIPWFSLSQGSMDYVPPFPWLSAVLLGVFLYYQNVHKIQFTLYVIEPVVQFFGKHALLVYLIHQPILYGMAYGYVTFMKN